MPYYPPPQSSTPTGAAGGDLAGTYPNPTLNTSISTAVAFSGLGATVIAANGALSAPAFSGTGTWVTGGTATTTKPYVLIQPSAATSTAWNTSGTGLGVNAASGFGGRLADFQVNGTSLVSITSGGSIFFAGSATSSIIGSNGSAFYGVTSIGTSTNALVLYSGANISISSSASLVANAAVGDVILSRGGAATWQLGAATGSGAAVAQTLQAQGSSGNSAAAALFTIAGSDQAGTTTTGGGLKIRGGNGTSAGGTVEIWTSATTTPAVAATFTATKQTKLAGNLWLDNTMVTGLTPAVSAGLLSKSIILYDNTGAAITLYGS